MSETTTSTETSSETVTEAVAQKVETQSQDTQVASPVETTQDVNEEVQSQDSPEQPSKLDFNQLIEDYIYDGLTEEMVAQVEKMGLTADQFQLMAEAQKAVQTKNNEELYGLVGGQEAYEELKVFAIENLNEQEIEGFNAALFSGSMNMARVAVLGLKALKEAQMGSKPTVRVSGSTHNNTGVEPFRSQAEVVAAMNNRRYRLDASYKAEVDARRAASEF